MGDDIFEEKNDFPDEFTVYQLFMPFLYYQKLKETHRLPIKNINYCYLLRKKHDEGSILKIYLYDFARVDDMASMRLLKAKEYHLKTA